jgi:hypothetical protein
VPSSGPLSLTSLAMLAGMPPSGSSGTDGSQVSVASVWVPLAWLLSAWGALKCDDVSAAAVCHRRYVGTRMLDQMPALVLLKCTIFARQ